MAKPEDSRKIKVIICLYRTDFLPIWCYACEGTFCKEHSSTESHQCSQCNIPERVASNATGPKSIPCFVEGCNNKELVQVVCEHCHNNFCLSHRHQQEHQCPLLVVEPGLSKTAEHVKNILESKQPVIRKNKGVKSKKTAAKVALMKMKMSVTGNRNIAECDRMYLMILAPALSSTSSKPILFSKKWSVGMVIDKAAETLGIQNNNNVLNAKKLRLFDSEDGSLICRDLERTFESLETENVIINGGTLILEYVEEDCAILEQTQNYK